MKSPLLSKNLYIMELPYKIVYLIFAIFTFCNLTFMKPIMSFAVIAVLGFSLLAIIPRIIGIKGYLKTPGLFLIIAFFISFFISFILNVDYGYSDNFKGLIWLGLHFFTLFACDIRRSEKEYKKEFSFIAIFYLAVFFLMSFISIMQYIFNYHFEDYNDVYNRILGVVWGRLWGIYRDPNYASVFATIAIFLSVYFIKKYPKKLIKTALITNIVIQFLYIALSGSRTGMVALFICSFFYIIMIGLKKPSVKTNLKRAAVIAIALAVCLSGTLIISGIHEINSEITEYRFYLDPDNDGSSEYLDLREQDIEGDISNRRFDLWGSGVEIFTQKPIFGVSYFNLQQFAEKEMPDTYLVNNDHGAFNNMHNLIFNILPAQGIVGTVIFLAFAVFAVVYIFKNIFKADGEDYEYLTVLFVCIIASLISSMFVTDIVYTNSPTSITFWLFMGYLFHYFKRKKLTESAKNE